MIKLNLVISLLMLSPVAFVFGQIDTLQLENDVILKSIKYWESKDSSGDTYYYNSLSQRYVVENKDGEVVVEAQIEGGVGEYCSSNFKPHGYWLGRYRSGKIKEMGKYNCGQKQGLWTYFYENGNMKKVEEFHPSYIKLFTKQQFEWDTLSSNDFFKTGVYQEYYESGQLKVEGNYQLVEVYSDTKSKLSYDPDTFEELKIVLTGEFWVPKSIKVGFWNEYDENGVIIKHEEYKVKYDFITIRPIESRYIETIESVRK